MEIEMSILTENYPPGPCGQCGATDTFYVSVAKEWVQPAHAEGYYNPPHHVSADCAACNAASDGEFLREVYGGQPGYAIGLLGKFFGHAMALAGWLHSHPTMLD